MASIGRSTRLHTTFLLIPIHTIFPCHFFFEQAGFDAARVCGRLEGNLAADMVWAREDQIVGLTVVQQ